MVSEISFRFFTPLNFPVGTLFNGVNMGYDALCEISLTGFTERIPIQIDLKFRYEKPAPTS